MSKKTTDIVSIKEYLLLTILLIVGLSFLIIEQAIDNRDWLWTKPYLNAFSTTLLMGGLLGILYKKYVDGEHYKEIRKILKIHESVQNAGLLEIYQKSKDYKYTELITYSEDLIILINDGNKWVTLNASEIRDRFNRKTKTIFIHLADDNLVIDALCNKVNYRKEEYISKLQTTRTELIKLYEESSQVGSLQIYGLQTYPCQSIYLTESKLVITPYQTAAMRLNIPAYVYNASNKHVGYAKEIRTDIANILKNNVVKLYDSESQKNQQSHVTSIDIANKSNQLTK